MSIDCIRAQVGGLDFPKTTGVAPKQAFQGLSTENLQLRFWKEGDVDKIHNLMQDPDVNCYLQHHNLHKRETIASLATKSMDNLLNRGYGYFICEHRYTGEVIGLMGLNYVEMEAPDFPCFTVSWILGKNFWGKGYATEAATALINYGLNVCDLPAIYACTTDQNKASQKVMERLQMSFVRTFSFPGMSKDDPLSNYVLYVKEKETVKS